VNADAEEEEDSTRREECYGLKKGVYKAAGRTGAKIASG